MRNRRAEVSKVTWKLTAFGSHPTRVGRERGAGDCLVGHNQIDACIGCASDRRWGGGTESWKVVCAEDNQQSLSVNFMFISNNAQCRTCTSLSRIFLTELRETRIDLPGHRRGSVITTSCLNGYPTGQYPPEGYPVPDYPTECTYTAPVEGIARPLGALRPVSK